MRIGVNLIPLSLDGGGMRQYVMQLLPELARQSHHEFVLFHAYPGMGSIAAILQRLPRPAQDRVTAVRVCHEQDIYKFAGKFDLLFSPLNGTNLRLFDRPSVAVLADIQEKFFPEYFRPEDLRARAITYPHTARTTTRLITLSEFSKRTICEQFDLDPARVRVTHLAPSDDLLHCDSEWPSDLPPLPDRFVFYPANSYPHKNHDLLFQAIRRLKDEFGIVCPCVLTGRAMPHGADLRRLAENQGISELVHWHVYVPPGAIKHLYERALALCFPSQFEGFGLPIVEAMSIGCPVIATHTSSVPEVGGDAIQYVSPDPASLATAIHSLWTNPAQCVLWANLGRKRAGMFSTSNLAERTLAIFDEATEAFHADRAIGRRPRVSFLLEYNRRRASFVAAVESILPEMADDDELIVLGTPSRLSLETEMMLANIPNCRSFQRAISSNPTQWIPELRGQIVVRLGPGESLLPGAVDAAAAALARDPDLLAVVGETLSTNDDAAVPSLPFFLEPGEAQLFLQKVPASAVAWRIQALQAQSDLLRKRNPENWLLSTLPRSRIRAIPRTFSIVRTRGALESVTNWTRSIAIACDLAALYRQMRADGRVDSMQTLVACALLARRRALAVLRHCVPYLETHLKRWRFAARFRRTAQGAPPDRRVRITKQCTPEHGIDVSRHAA